MKLALTAFSLSALLLAAPAAIAQNRSATGGGEIEAIVTVTKVDREKRTVTFRGPQGNVTTLPVPEQSQNLDQVKPGSRFKIKYTESAAVSLNREGKPDAKVDKDVQMAKKGANPGGKATQTVSARVLIEAIDYTNRVAALRGPNGVFSVKIPADVNLDRVAVGDRINVVYTQAIALEMIPEKPAAKKK